MRFPSAAIGAKGPEKAERGAARRFHLSGTDETARFSLKSEYGPDRHTREGSRHRSCVKVCVCHGTKMNRKD